MIMRSAFAILLLGLTGTIGCSGDDSDDGYGLGSSGSTGGGTGSTGGGTGSTGGGTGSTGGGTGSTAGGTGSTGGGNDGNNCNQDVDVVFVLDVSGSMIAPLTTLEQEVGLVHMALESKNLPSPPHYGLVIFVDDHIVLNGGAPYADITALTTAVTNEIVTTNANLPRQAAGGFDNFNWPENSLDGLYAAATEFQWRPADTTLRTIIHITDASFWDQELLSSTAGDSMGLEMPGSCTAVLGLAPGVCSVHGYMETITALRDNNVWVNSFTAKTGGPQGPTMSPPSHSLRGVDVNVGIGFFEPYNGMPPIAASTGGTAFDIDEVYDGLISMAKPINDSIADSQCMEYPPIPVL